MSIACTLINQGKKLFILLFLDAPFFTGYLSWNIHNRTLLIFKIKEYYQYLQPQSTGITFNVNENR